MDILLGHFVSVAMLFRPKLSFSRSLFSSERDRYMVLGKLLGLMSLRELVDLVALSQTRLVQMLGSWESVMYHGFALAGSDRQATYAGGLFGLRVCRS